jgi:hypothetical protein
VVPTLFRLTKISARSYIKPLANYLYIINLILQIIYFFKESLVGGISCMLQTRDFKMAPSSKAVQIGGQLSLCFGQMVLSLILHPTSASTITTIFVLLPSGVLKH